MLLWSLSWFFWLIFLSVDCPFEFWYPLLLQFCTALSWQRYYRDVKFCISCFTCLCFCWTGNVAILRSCLLDIRFVLQLMKLVSRVRWKSVKYYNRIAILRSFVLPAEWVLLVMLTWNLNDSESVILSFASKL